MKIRGVVFDWAGTIVDFGSLAPMAAFVDLFARHGITISVDQARIPMGLPKIDHIRALAQLPQIAAQWDSVFSRDFNEDDAQALLQEFEPMSAQSALQCSDFIPGLLDTQIWLQRHAIRIATTTGYTRHIMTPLIAQAHELGFRPELVICCDDVARSRPDPMGMYACMKAMDLEGLNEHVVKVDDTAPGLAEGRNAGCWTVGVAASGNALGWSLQEWHNATPMARSDALSHASQQLLDAGADEVVPTVAELPHAILRIEQRMAHGERPRC